MKLDTLFHLDLAGDRLDLKKLDLTVPDVDLSASGSVARLTGSPMLDLSTSLKLSLDSLVADLAPAPVLKKLPEGFKTSGRVEIDAQAQGPAENYRQMKLSGRLQIRDVGVVYGSYPAVEGMNGQLDFSNTLLNLSDLAFKLGKHPIDLKAQVSGFSLADLKGALVNLTLQAFQGTLKAQVRANLAVPGTSYGYAVDLAGLNVEDAVNTYADTFPKDASLQQLRNKVFGTLAASARGTGKGLSGAAMEKNLDLTGSFKLAKGKFSHLDMAQKLASVIPYPPVSNLLMSDITFDRTQSDFALKGGKASWTDLVEDTGADGRQGSTMIQSHGFYVLGGAIDTHVILHFNPSVVKLQGTAQEAFADDKGWPTFDVAYYGPTLKQAKADFSQGLKKAAGRVVNRQIDQLKQKAVQQGQQQMQQLLQKQGGGLLKGLFGH